jgi:hypothetical protein
MEKMEFDKIDDNYNYLIKLPMDSVTEENVEKLISQHSNKSEELETLNETEITTMWSKELTELIKIYQTTQKI